MREYASPQEAADDALFRPLTVAEVMERTGRSRRTVQRWFAGDGPLRVVDMDGVRVAIEREVLELEQGMRQAAAQSKANLAARRRTAPDCERID